MLTLFFLPKAYVPFMQSLVSFVLQPCLGYKFCCLFNCTVGNMAFTTEYNQCLSVSLTNQYSTFTLNKFQLELIVYRWFEACDLWDGSVLIKLWQTVATHKRQMRWFVRSSHTALTVLGVFPDGEFRCVVRSKIKVYMLPLVLDARPDIMLLDNVALVAAVIGTVLTQGTNSCKLKHLRHPWQFLGICYFSFCLNM